MLRSRPARAGKAAAAGVALVIFAGGGAPLRSQDSVGQSAAAGQVTGLGNFGHTVANLERSVAFYHGALGLDLARPPAPFATNLAISRMTDTIGGQSRIAVVKIPGANWGIELIDYKGIERRPAHPRFQDPGAANLSLRVRDLDAMLAALEGAGAKVLTLGGRPVSRGGKARVIYVQDPDGFVVELNQPDPVAEGGAGAGNVISGAIEVTVADAERTLNFYRDVLGFAPQPGGNATFNADKTMTDTAGTPGAAFRQRRALVPGTAVPVTFIEFRGIARRPLAARVRDPGSAVLQLRVRDAAATANALKAGGATIISVGGEPADLGNGLHIAIVRDPNNLFLELIQAPGR